MSMARDARGGVQWRGTQRQRGVLTTADLRGEPEQESPAATAVRFMRAAVEAQAEAERKDRLRKLGYTVDCLAITISKQLGFGTQLLLAPVARCSSSTHSSTNVATSIRRR
jgi:hypothetical protein